MILLPGDAPRPAEDNGEAGTRLVAAGAGARCCSLVAFVLPVGMMVPTSLRPYVPLVGITGGFTARHYIKLLTDSYYLEIIGRTLGAGAHRDVLDAGHRLSRWPSSWRAPARAGGTG